MPGDAKAASTEDALLGGGLSRYIEERAVSVAQLVELLVVVQVVAGSSPVAHPSGKPCRGANSTWLLTLRPDLGCA
jgi:hypothetical protein